MPTRIALPFAVLLLAIMAVSYASGPIHEPILPDPVEELAEKLGTTVAAAAAYLAYLACVEEAALEMETCAVGGSCTGPCWCDEGQATGGSGTQTTYTYTHTGLSESGECEYDESFTQNICQGCAGPHP